MWQAKWTRWLFLGLLTSIVLFLVFYWRMDFITSLTGFAMPTLPHFAAPLAGGGAQGRGARVFSAEISRRDEVKNTSRHGTPLAQDVQRMCRLQFNTDTNDSAHTRILVDDKHKLLFCCVPKVACLNWRRVLLVLSGKANATNPEDIPPSYVFNKFRYLLPKLSQFNKTAAQHRLRTYFKFMFVRNPFERLLSAWRNKFVDTTPNSLAFRRRYGPTILKRYRNSSIVYLQYLKRMRESEMLVQFIEFLSFVTDNAESGKRLNNHWERFHRLCNPCSMRYDFVGKYETLEEDVLQVLEKTRVDSWVSFPRRSNIYKHQSTASVMEQFYRDVPVPLLERLHRVFEEDFQLFEYSAPDFMDLITA